MNDIDKIMSDLKYLNQFARVLKSEEQSGIKTAIYLIAEQSDEITEEKDGVVIKRVWNKQVFYVKHFNKIKVVTEVIIEELKDDEVIFSKTHKKDPVYAEFYEEMTNFSYTNIDAEKIMEIRDNTIDSKEIYKIKDECIELLYKLGLLIPYKHKGMAFFKWDETHGFHLPLHIAKDWIDHKDLEELPIPKPDWEAIDKNYKFPKNKKHVKIYPDYLIMSPKDVYRLRDTVRNLAGIRP